MNGDALLSEDGVFRYWLIREWDPGLPTMTFVLLNPSTADAAADDPTMRRCIGFAKRDGFGGIRVLNLYAFRATRPVDMRRAVDPVGPDNDEHLRDAFGAAQGAGAPVVAAWGGNATATRVSEVVALARAAGVQLQAFEVNRDGSPKHPLYVHGQMPLKEWAIPDSNR